ncbi:atrial natriuretic peptide receptor 3 isoform X2, partial [Biomphalaria glabrata]
IVLCASPDSVRDIMIKAHDLNFDNGEYVFFNIDLFSSVSQTVGVVSMACNVKNIPSASNG